MTQHLKCDAAGCGHDEIVEELSAELIGKPCPRCGANLLTESDYRFWVRLQRVVRLLKWLGLAKDHNGEPDPTGKYHLTRIHHHAGVTTIKREKVQ